MSYQFAINAPLGFANTSLEQELACIKKAGFDGVFFDWSRETDLFERVALAKKVGLPLQSVHGPIGKAAKIWEGGAEAEEACAEVLDCLEDCAKCGAPIVILHSIIGMDRHTPTASGLEQIGRIVKRAKELGLRLAFENVEGEEYLAAVMEAYGHEDCVGFCLDTGHESCYNLNRDQMALYGKKLFCTHLNDNLGCRHAEITWFDDLHLMPFDGKVDFSWVMRRIRASGYQGFLTFELSLVAHGEEDHTHDAYNAMTAQEYYDEMYRRARRVASL